MYDDKNKANNEDTGGEGIPTAGYSGAAAGPGGKIGPYKLLRILGEGGYGIVYLAEQQQPVKRRVALKVIKPGMDTKQVIARFEAERQALALLDHPNIAHVFDAGTTEAGRPYFAMEYVKGIPITEHCDRYKLTIEERLKLFLSVCEAVQHAHQKAIIHRDIKPSNILVAYEAEQTVPMIIDFGVAKALSQSLTERTLITEQAQMIGTPEYMSPEQAEMTSQDIDTRTDIYSLGVLLYELLTGTLPFDPKTLREGGPERMRRLIREQDPQTPSVRLSTIERDESLSLAQQRRTDIRTWEHRLHGELDWITLKAMDKDRTRRYQTAHALAEDIQRYLNQEPVLAGPPSTLYRVRKYIRRHQALATGLAAVLLVLLAGLAGIVAFAVRADRQAHRAQAVVDFLNEDLLTSVVLRQSMTQQVTVQSVLDAASARLEGRFVDEPLVEATIRDTLGRVYVELGDYGMAESHLTRAYDLHQAKLGDMARLTLRSMSQLGHLYHLEGRYEEAKELLAQALDSQRRVLGPDDTATLETGVWLGVLYMELTTPHLLKQAEELLTAVVESKSSSFGRESPVVLEAQYGLAFLRGFVRWRIGEGIRMCREGLDTTREVLGEEHRLAYRFMSLLALYQAFDSQFEEAQRQAKAALQVYQSALPDDHPDTLGAMCTLGMVYELQNRLQEAAALLEPGIERLRGGPSARHNNVLLYSRSLARVYLRQGRYQDAKDWFNRILEDGREPLAESHPLLMTTRAYMQYLYTMQEKSEELKTWSSRQSDELDDKMAKAYLWNALAWLQATYPSSVIRDANAALENARRACVLSDWQSASCIDTLATACAENEDFAAAIEYQKQAIANTEDSNDIISVPSEWLRYNLRLFQSRRAVRECFFSGTGRSRIAEEQYDAAEKELEAAMKAAQRYLGETHPETRGCILGFIELYETWGKPEEAEKWRSRLPAEASSPEH
jgi:serine/threonine protein kinase